MSIKSAVCSVYRATELDVVRSSSLVSVKQAKSWTERNNLGNAAMYTLNAFIPVTGLINAIVGVGKVGFGLLAAATSLGEKGERQAARYALGVDFFKSGFENMVVGAACCIPGAGTYIGLAMAARSISDAVVADKTVLAS